MPDLISIALLAIILLISLKILDYARRVVMFWVLLVFRLVFWGSVLALALYVWRVGIENTGRDLGWVFGVVEGFVGDFQAQAGAGTSNRGMGARERWGVGGNAGGRGSGRKGYSRGW